MSSRRKLLILGATGSVGQSTLAVASLHPEKIEIVALTANRNVAEMKSLIDRFKPKRVLMVDSRAAAELAATTQDCEVLTGREGLLELASEGSTDVVMSSIVGGVGLEPTLAAIRAGKRVLIANKEPLVMAGELMMAEAKQSAAEIIPIDSEHNAIFQCLPGQFRCGDAPVGVKRLILTASGGPFRTTPIAELSAMTPEQAVAHPNWSMGRKISVDSATLMNKGLELIEASMLYRLGHERLDVVIHPESVIHSLVEYVDGSSLAQMGQPDMRVPIAHALAFPERWDSGVDGLDLPGIAQFNFESPDHERFPCLGLAMEALQRRGNFPNILNAANEVAVEAFLNRQIGFSDISRMVESCCNEAEGAGLPAPSGLAEILEVERWARARATKTIASVVRS